MPPIQYTFFGLDLGQRNDFSALAVLDYRSFKFYLRGVRRFPLGTAYTAIPRKVRDAVAQPPTSQQSALAVDAGGPGLPVVELLRQANLGCAILPAIISGGGGNGALLPGGMCSVPRRELVSLLRLSLEDRLLVFPADMPLKNELNAELGAIHPIGGQSKHDDMAIAIALALWAGAVLAPGLLQQKAA